MHSLISHSELKVLEVVSDPSVLAGTAAAHLQDDLSSRRSFERHHTQIYSPRDLLCLDYKCTLNMSTSETVFKKKAHTPNNTT